MSILLVLPYVIGFVVAIVWLLFPFLVLSKMSAMLKEVKKISDEQSIVSHNLNKIAKSSDRETIG